MGRHAAIMSTPAELALLMTSSHGVLSVTMGLTIIKKNEHIANKETTKGPFY